MPIKMRTKLKTNRAAAKRFRATKNGFKHRRQDRNHILTKKTAKRKRQLRPLKMVHASDQQAIARLLTGT